jgi:sugar lactone lactonase YvrE
MPRPHWRSNPRYKVRELLGVGGMGAVYRAEHLLMARPVALKVINKGLIDNRATVERFRREVQAAARLVHPNIVTAYDADQAGDAHFLVMEYVEGRSLARLLAEKGPLPVRQACDYIRQAALGLQHAHEQGMVHRDIKPHNLMLTPDGRVKILDFGLARFAAESAPAAASRIADAGRDTPTGSGPGQLTQLGVVVGTPDYIAPEQAADAHAADIRADIYSLGCTLYDLLAGRPPFPEETAVRKVLAHAQRQPQPLRELRKDVPPALARVVERMLAKDPARRYQTPAEVVQALAPFAGIAVRPRRWLLYAACTAISLLFIGMMLERAVVYLTARIDPKAKVVDPGYGGFKYQRRFDGHQGSVKSVAFSPDGRLALTGSGYPTSDNSARVWDVSSGRERVSFAGHGAPVCAVAFSPDGQLALSGGSDNTVRLWKVADGQEVRCFRGHTAGIGSVAFSPDGRRALSGGWDSTIRLWDVETGDELKRLRGHKSAVQSVVFSRDGQRILSGSSDKSMRLWDVETGHELKRFLGSTQTVSGVALSPDGLHALSASDAVRLWDLSTGQAVRRFEGTTGHIETVAFSPDGRQALAAGWDGNVRLWDVATGEALACAASTPAEVQGNGTWWSLAFSPDGQFVLSGGNDGAAVLWKVPGDEHAPGP